MKIRMLTVFTALALGLGAGCASDQGPDTSAGVEAAEAWLVLVDAGSYAESWEQASAHFKGVVSQADWVSALEGLRTPLGASSSRAVASAQHKTALPGAPDGEYVIVQFDTSFENKQSAGETVTPALGEDGVWRVSGYYIR